MLGPWGSPGKWCCSLGGRESTRPQNHFSRSQHHFRQPEVAETVIREVCARRGIEWKPIKLFAPRPTSEWGVRLRWLNLAHEAGYDRTARKHAYALLRRNPLSIRAWRVVFRAWIGIENAGRIRSMMNLLTGRPRSTGKTADT